MTGVALRWSYREEVCVAHDRTGTSLIIVYSVSMAAVQIGFHDSGDLHRVTSCCACVLQHFLLSLHSEDILLWFDSLPAASILWKGVSVFMPSSLSGISVWLAWLGSFVQFEADPDQSRDEERAVVDLDKRKTDNCGYWRVTRSTQTDCESWKLRILTPLRLRTGMPQTGIVTRNSFMGQLIQLLIILTNEWR